MLRPIKDKYIAGYRLGCDKVGILGHISSSVDLVWVIDPLNDLDACGRVSVE